MNSIFFLQILITIRLVLTIKEQINELETEHIKLILIGRESHKIQILPSFGICFWIR